jgi:hypothetical protein
MCTIKKNTEALLITSKKSELEVNADKTKYMVTSQDQNAGRSHNIKNDNSSFERVEQFTYLGTTLTDQKSIQEEIKSRLETGNTWYHLLQKNKICRTVILPVLMGVKLGRSH